LNRAGRLSIALIVGLVLLALAFYGIDFRAVGRSIERARVPLLAVAAALYLFAYLVRAARWRVILRPITHVPVGQAYSMLMAGYFLNYVIPVRAGEIAKSFFLKRLRGLPIATTLPTVYVDKLLELVSIVFVVLMVPILSIQLTRPLLILVLSVLGIFAIAVLLLVLAFRRPEATTRILCGLFAWLPRRAYERLSGFLGLFVEGMGVARENARALPLLLGLTAAAVLVDASYFFVMFRAFGVDAPFSRVLFGYTLLTLSYILPTPPAQIGYNELVIGLIFAGGLAGAGVTRDQILAVVVVAHALTGALITFVGLGSFWSMGIRVSESFRRVAGSNAAETAGGGAGPCKT
jgi:uncharacterized protein (TIRG00374 family)